MEELERNTANETNRQNSRTHNLDIQGNVYLYLFERFIEDKMNADQISNKTQVNLNQLSASKKKLRDTNRMISEQLMKRKLGQNNSESRMNKMLGDFKNLGTYINIKNFIQQINDLNYNQAKKRQDTKNEKQFEEFNQKNLYQQVRQIQFKELMTNSGDYNHNYKELFQKVDNYVRPLIRINTDQIEKELELFYREIDLMWHAQNNLIDQKEYQNPLQCIFNKESKKQHDQTQYQRENKNQFIVKKRRESKQRFEKEILQKPLPCREIDQKYYSQFKRKAADIQKKMRIVLQNMLTKKWRKKEKQIEMRKKQRYIKKYFYEDKENTNKKPIINIKYKIYAPKNFFRFRVGKDILQQPLPHKQVIDMRRIGKTMNGIDTINTNRNEISSVNDRYRNSINIHKSDHLKIKKVRYNQKLSMTHKNAQNFKTQLIEKNHIRKLTQPDQILVPDKKASMLEQLKIIKDKYNFKKPIIKESILKKIDDFINKTEGCQYEFRKDNQHYNNMINRFENHKELDYDKFKEQKIEINTEEIKVFHNLVKFKR